MPKQPLHFHIPTSGVRDDLLAFMNEFLELKTVRFSEFSEIWRSKKMSYLCAGRHSDGEAREFLERVFMIALDFFLPPYQFQVRVGGLYLLYSIHMTQPIMPRVQVRLTQRQWRETMRFQQEAAQQNHLDVVYVFNKMLQEHAFQFCFTAVEMRTRSQQHEIESSGINLAEDMKEERRDIDRLFNYEAMEQLSYLLDHYQQMKVNLAGPEATQPDKSLDVVQGKMVEGLVSMLQSFKTSVGNIQKHGKAEPEEDKNEKEQEQSGETIGSRRQALRARAFSQMIKSSTRSRFDNSVENNLPSTEKSLEQASSVCQTQTEDSGVTSSNIKTKGRRASVASKSKEDTKRRNNQKMNHSSLESQANSVQVLSDSDIISGNDTISVEVYSKSRPCGTVESSAKQEIELSSKDDGRQEMKHAGKRKRKNVRSLEFQFNKVDASCYISCAKGRGTKVALPVFENVDNDPPAKSASKSKDLDKTVSQAAQGASNDSPTSGSKVQTSAKSSEKGNRKKSKMLDSAGTDSCKKGSQQHSEKVNSDNSINKKGRKRRKTKPALTSEELQASQSKAKKHSPKVFNNKKEDSSAVPNKESGANVSVRGRINDKPKRPNDGESSTSNGGQKVAFTKKPASQNIKESSKEQNSCSPSNEINKVDRQRKVRRRKSKTAVTDVAPKSSLAQTSVQEMDLRSESENFESPCKRIKVKHHEIATTGEERELKLKGKGNSKHITEKATVRRSVTENQEVNESEVKSSNERLSKRKRSLRESDEYSLDVSVREGLSQPKTITPLKTKRKCLEGSPLKGNDANSNLSNADKKSVKKSPAKGNDTNTSLSKLKTTVKDSHVEVTGDETKSEQTRQEGKSVSSPAAAVRVKEVLVYKEPNKDAIFTERVESNSNTTSPSAVSISKEAQMSSKRSVPQSGDMEGQQIVKNINFPKSQTSKDQEMGSQSAANLPDRSKKTTSRRVSGNKVITTSTSPKKTHKKPIPHDLEMRYI